MGAPRKAPDNPVAKHFKGVKPLSERSVAEGAAVVAFTERGAQVVMDGVRVFELVRKFRLANEHLVLVRPQGAKPGDSRTWLFQANTAALHADVAHVLKK